MKLKKFFTQLSSSFGLFSSFISIITWKYVDFKDAINNPNFNRDMPIWIIITVLIGIAIFGNFIGLLIEKLIKKTIIKYLDEKSEKIEKLNKEINSITSNILILKEIEDVINNHAEHLRLLEKYSNASSNYLHKDKLSGEAIYEHQPKTINLTNEHS